MIVLVKVNDLSASDAFVLKYVYKGDKTKFIISRRGNDIIINSEHEHAEELKDLAAAIMDCKYLNKRTEKLMDCFEELAGKEAGDTVLRIWLDWRKEMQKLELKAQAEDIIRQAKQKRIMGKAKRQNELIHALFSLGYGMYDKSAKCDFEQGAQFCFLYGYMMGLLEKEKNKN